MIKDWSDYVIPVLYFAISLGVGILAENVVLKKLARTTLKTRWKGDDVVLYAFRGMAIAWSIIAGLYLALHNAGLPEKIIAIGDKVFFSAATISVGVVASRILVGFIRLKSQAAGVYPSTSIVANIIRIGVYVVSFLVILQTLGISITPILTALGVGALAVALALQDTLSNLFSGVQVIASRQVRLGDYVRLDTGEEGYVADITWRNTIIRALSNNYVIVPNSKIASAILTNYYLPEKEMSVLVDVGVSYDSDLEKVEEVTIATGREVLAETTGGVKNHDPFIRYNTFGDSAIQFTVILRAQEFTDQYLVKHVFIKRLCESYRANGIKIPFPVRHVILETPKQE